ncbi:MAG: hypothetical protein COX62_08620 [Deltaproteobacteria bacterium CG_4_10_14_0_2_um_filter_43_8]|nr:MAG: hypothetical protein COV43_06245 [Deltaproteobacteria bacterium CG11_big_fil_rev_8_21_14_0_20_42_23]PJA18451.1 MAG: hypothetical protein COX62_08620 [Deltaproteobacteria bacterium CG_4_10_14_0_2_um_filter_43_8]PJC64432.1 MAG: hypothetical protein CO021_04320 [Deltaproteobacteria bacterium CG_4_9_14_0_2_um_filter_42_21]
MKKRFFLFAAILFVVCSTMNLEQVHSDGDPQCPTDECLVRHVTQAGNGDDEDDRSLRNVLRYACRDKGDDLIVFGRLDTIRLHTPLTIPADCDGRIFMFGKPNVRNVISGTDIDMSDGELTDNCMLKVESNNNEFEYLSFVNFKNRDAENHPGIGLCFIGNGNRAFQISSGVLPASEGNHGNDIGIYIEGDANSILKSQISQNTLDGILVDGDRNLFQGNNIGRSYEDCSRIPPEDPSDKDDKNIPLEQALTEENNAVTDESENNPVVNAHPATSGGCQLIAPTPNEDAPLNDFEGDSFEQKEAEYKLGGECAISNGKNGIHLRNTASKNQIGGFQRENHNIFSYNGVAGVRLDGTSESFGNRINNNVFYHNYGLGIDLGQKGVNENDAEDIDQGPNALVNFPHDLRVKMRSLYRPDGRLTYTFQLTGYALQHSVLEVYLTDGSTALEVLQNQGDPSGFGEGENMILPEAYLVESEDGKFTLDLPTIIPRRTKITTLLTDENGNTSEFSENVILEQDSDGDGIIDLFEDRIFNELVDEGESDPFNIDTDGDGLLDGIEDKNRNGIQDVGETSAVLADSDNDGLSDYIETKGDGIYEFFIASDTDPLNPDTDCDGLKDGEEDANGNGVVEFYLGETDPRNPDSDGDNFSDSPKDCNGNPLQVDNCPTISNPGQEDTNDNGIGDRCEVNSGP